MKKKGVIIFSIVCWLIGLFVIFCLVGIKVHYMEEETPKVFDVSNVKESERIYQVANGTIKKGDPLFESALLSRISLSDSVVKENGVSRERVTVFASKNGEHALSRGIWHEIVKEGENGEIDLVDGLIGVVNIYDAIEEGYGKEIYDFLCQTPDGKIRLDEYAMNNAICYPLRLSLLDENGNKVGEIECNTNKDFSGYEKCSATDVWLYHKDTWGGLEMMKLQLEFAMNMSGEASEYATAVAKQLDFESDIKKKGVVRVTPTKGVGCVVATQGDYYMISLEVVSKPRLLAIWFGIVAVLWTMWLAARVWIRWSRL